MCDALVKLAVTHSLHPDAPTRVEQILSKEGAAVFFNNVKQTTGVTNDTRLALRKVEARKFYVSNLKWAPD